MWCAAIDTAYCLDSAGAFDMVMGLHWLDYDFVKWTHLNCSSCAAMVPMKLGFELFVFGWAIFVVDSFDYSNHLF